MYALPVASPYRSADAKRTAAPLEDGGIVDDLIQQFADPLAFYRELVQNAIDAGSETIEIRLSHRDNEMRVTVSDRGEGMSSKVIEEKLLVLFRSGKEGLADKIGKFGVGFVSVLALEPSRVVVQTTRGDGRAFTLHLFADHQYELFESASNRGSGTTVTLEIPMTGRKVSSFIKRSRRSLRRWCRHAKVPIQLVVQRQRKRSEPERIDEPLQLDNVLASVHHRRGKTEVVVGLPPADARPYAGFFNQGLTLFETQELFGAALSGVHFKVQDARLEHTLSRDNIRRDRAFRAALKVVQETLDKKLPAVILEQLKANAGRKLSHYHELLWRGSHLLSRDEIWVPLLEPLNGQTVLQVKAADSWAGSTTRSELTAQLARFGVAVANLQNDESGILAKLLNVPPAESTLTLIEPVHCTDSDYALVASVEEHLKAAHRQPQVQLVTMVGKWAGLGYVAAPIHEAARVETNTKGDPFRIFGRSGLLLNVDYGIVERARELAKTDPQVAGALVARDALLHFEALGERQDESLTLQALRRIGMLSS